MTIEKSHPEPEERRPRPLPPPTQYHSLLSLRSALDEARDDVIQAAHLAREISRKAHVLALLIPAAFRALDDATEIYNRLVAGHQAAKEGAS